MSTSESYDKPPAESRLRVPKISAKQKGYLLLRADIISQKMRPGQVIREDEISRRIGLSRTPVRELLRMLEQEDLVRVVPHKGVFVSDLTPDDIEEILDIRIALETAAARSAACKITPDHVGELNDIIKGLDSAVKGQDSIASFEADSALHDLILSIAGNNRARRIISNLMGQILRVRFISGHKPGRIGTTANEQRQIVRSLVARDPDKAADAMHRHISNTKQVLLSTSDMDDKFDQFVRKSFASSDR